MPVNINADVFLPAKTLSYTAVYFKSGVTTPNQEPYIKEYAKQAGEIMGQLITEGVNLIFFWGGALFLSLGLNVEHHRQGIDAREKKSLC
jgi:hypothetical protein